MTAIMAQRACAPAPSRPRPPNILAERITGRPYLSHSQVSLMRACPRKFSFQYVENVPKDFIPASLLLGGAIHAALELWFRAALEGLNVTHEALLSAYHDAWRRQQEQAGGDLPIRFNKGDDPDTLHALADRLLTAFRASPLAHPRGTLLGIEEELRIVLDEALPDFLARVDLVTQTEDALHVIDWKTSRSRWTEQKAHESGEQLVLYGVTVQQLSISLGLPVKLHFGIITKAKKPVIQLLAVPTDPDRVAVLKENVASLWEAIQSGNFYPSPSPQNCVTCPFKSRCPVYSKH